MHSVVKDGLTFLCVASDKAGTITPFTLLDDVVERFSASYGRGYELPSIAIPYGMNEFSRVLAERAKYYSCNPADNSLSQTQTELEETRKVLTLSLERLLEREERLDNLANGTDRLNLSATEFQQRTMELRRELRWRNIKMVFMLIMVLFMGAYLLIGLACGFPDWNRCRDINNRTWK